MARRATLTAASVLLLLALILAYLSPTTSRSTSILSSSGLRQFYDDADCDVEFTKPNLFDVSQPQLAELDMSATQLPRMFELARYTCASVLVGYNDMIAYEYQNPDKMKTSLHDLYASASNDLPVALAAASCDAAKIVLWRMGMALRQISQELWSGATSLWHDTEMDTMESLILNAVHCSRWSALSSFLADIWLSTLGPNASFQHAGIDEELAVIGRVDACELSFANATRYRYCWRRSILSISSSVRDANEHLVHFWDHHRNATELCGNRFLRMAEDLCMNVLVDFGIGKTQATQQCSPATPISHE